MRRSALTMIAVGLLATLLAGSALVGGAAADDDHLRANLTGENEVPGPGAPGGASGVARVEVKPQKGMVCFKLRWEEISAPTAAHIHAGGADVAGPVVVTLFMTSEAPDQPPTLPETITAVEGCSDMVAIPEGASFDSTTQLLLNIKRNPGDYYVNVHNLDFPAGAIRGQLKG
ncbi:MAG: CHRD domain-containing protein [Actinomycetota bacterium]